MRTKERPDTAEQHAVGQASSKPPSKSIEQVKVSHMYVSVRVRGSLIYEAFFALFIGRCCLKREALIDSLSLFKTGQMAV